MAVGGASPGWVDSTPIGPVYSGLSFLVVLVTWRDSPREKGQRLAILLPGAQGGPGEWSKQITPGKDRVKGPPFPELCKSREDSGSGSKSLDLPGPAMTQSFRGQFWSLPEASSKALTWKVLLRSGLLRSCSKMVRPEEPAPSAMPSARLPQQHRSPALPHRPEHGPSFPG